MAKFSEVNTILNTSVTADGVAIFFKVKTVLKLAGWTVPASSDGTTYNTSGDQITTAGTGAGGLTNTNAWFIVREPGARREWCFQRVGSTGFLFRIKYSAFARFIGGSPSATRTPSATDEQTIAGSGTDAAPAGGSLFNAANLRIHIIANSTPIGGVYPFHMWATNTPGSTAQAGALWQEPMAPGSYDVADVDPCIVGAGVGGATISVLTSTSSRAWFAYGLGGATFLTLASGVNATFSGALPNDLASGKDVNGRPLYTASSGGVRIKGYGALVAIKGPARDWPATANRTSDAYVYLGSLVLPYADNTEPGV